MIRNSFTLALLGASAFMAIGAAQAQEPAPADAPALVSDAPAPDEATANNEFLQAQVESLQAQIDNLKKQMTAAQPTWKGAPQWSDPDSGFTFKPKGVLQFDAGYVSIPGHLTGAGNILVPAAAGPGGAGPINTNNLGWNMRARRLIFGAEGAIPGGFGYKIEFELSQGSVNYEDLILTWQKAGSPVMLTAGYHYPLSSLELLTSNRFTSFMERAAMNDAFGYGRRLGLSAAYLDPAGRYTLTAGVWGADINDSTNFNRNNWQASVRGTYSPMIGEVQGHLGFQFQHRSSATDARNVRYRVRPFTQTTDQRFIDTGRIAATGDDILGGELAAIYKSFHFASEFQYDWVRGISVNAFGPNNGTGGSAIFPAENPNFFSGYAEVGYFLTGETRGYKGGKWDRTKVLNPVGKGGFGAVQINARFDYTDLGDRIATGPLVSGTTYVNGGKMAGYQASLIWLPTDYVKFLLQYTRAHVEGGAAAVAPFTTSTQPFFDRPYNVDQVGLRAQLDF
jgi:phosphate-selective porin OprO and OprP